MIKLTREQAIEMGKSGVWKSWTSEQIVKFQLYQDKLCMPFGVFHKAVEEVLGRGVFTHEFGSSGTRALKAEYEGKKRKLFFQDIIDLLDRQMGDQEEV